MQLIDQEQVTIGAHTITFNRIAPPSLPAATVPTPAPRPAPQAALAKRTANRVSKTRAKDADHPMAGGSAGGGEKPCKPLFLSATVYDHQFSALRWYDGAAPALCAYVNIDCRYFTTLTSLETADAVYYPMLAWSDDTVDALAAAGQMPPDLAAFPAGRSSYQIIAGDPAAHPDAIAALNALCAYYDANGAQMIAAYNQRQAANAAQQQWLHDHPPVQPDTVINYWPTRNSVFLHATR